MKVIDYTTMRKNKDIQVCPKCGRKGLRIDRTQTTMNRPFICYDHRAEDYSGLRVVTDNCIITIQPLSPR